MSLKTCNRITNSLFAASILLITIAATINATADNPVLYVILLVLSMLCLVGMFITKIAHWRCGKCNKMLPLRALSLRNLSYCPNCQNKLNNGYPTPEQ